jgi:hypothetical protein
MVIIEKSPRFARAPHFKAMLNPKKFIYFTILIKKRKKRKKNKKIK